jgi:RNA polymerase sigma-70 factor (ECF subfamily)
MESHARDKWEGVIPVSQPSEASPAPRSADFRAAFEAEAGYVFWSLQRLGVRGSDLDDLTHDVFVAFYRHLADYDPARPLRPWLFGIAVKTAANYRRRARQDAVPSELMDLIPDGAPRADEQLASRQALALVNDALGALELDRRAVFVMHDLDGHAMPEIAAALGVPLNTAYSRLRLAREQFTAAVHRLRRTRGER